MMHLIKKIVQSNCNSISGPLKISKQTKGSLEIFQGLILGPWVKSWRNNFFINCWHKKSPRKGIWKVCHHFSTDNPHSPCARGTKLYWVSPQSKRIKQKLLSISYVEWEYQVYFSLRRSILCEDEVLWGFRQRLGEFWGARWRTRECKGLQWRLRIFQKNLLRCALQILSLKANYKASNNCCFGRSRPLVNEFSNWIINIHSPKIINLIFWQGFCYSSTFELYPVSLDFNSTYFFTHSNLIK